MPNRKIPENFKKKLLEESGWKCANPGCPVTSRFEIHHIREWAVYKTHDEKDMIAICPTCHSNVHYNKSLKIEDTEIYQWKKIIRNKTNVMNTHLWVEPSMHTKSMIFGPIKLISNKGLKPIKLGGQIIEYDVQDENLYFLNLLIKDQKGNILCKANHNVITSKVENGITINERVGRIEIIADLSTEILPEWALEELKKYDNSFVKDNKVKILDIKVDEPGSIKVSNLILVENNAAVVVSEDDFILIKRGKVRPLIYSEVKGLPFFSNELDYTESDHINPLIFLQINSN